MEGGLSFECFGGVVGVSEDTLFEWKKVHPSFSESYKKGRTKSMKHWEEMGHDMVLAGQGNATTWRCASIGFLIFPRQALYPLS